MVYKDFETSKALNGSSGALELITMMRLLNVFIFAGHLRLAHLKFCEHVADPQETV